MKVYLATAEVLVVKRKFYTATFGVLVAVLRRERLEQIKGKGKDKAKHLMTGWYVLFWRSQQTKFGKQGIHTLEGLVGTTRRLCAVEIVDINIDRNSFIVQNMHDALSCTLADQSC